jgi:hypothetical protein
MADPATANAAPSRAPRLYVLALLVAGAAYAATAQHGPAWQDSGIFQWRIATFQTSSDMGIALSHPLLIVAGKAMSLLPVGDVPWRMNLLSALCGAVAVANVTLLVWRMTRRAWPALLAGATLMLAHTTWWLATITESQTLLLALFTTELHVLLSLVRQPDVRMAGLLGVVNGLALSAHNLALLATPLYAMAVLAMVTRRRVSPWALAAMAGGWLLGASSIVAMVLAEASAKGWAQAIGSALFGTSWRGQVLGGSGAAVVRGMGYIVYNLPNLALPLAAVGAVLAWRRAGKAMAAAVCYMAGIYLLFAVRYSVVDQFMFFLPFYAMAAVLAGLALAWLTDRSARPRRWLTATAFALVLATPVIYAAAPAIWRASGLPVPGRKDLPRRDAARYWLVPWKTGETSARDFAAEALEQARPEGCVIIADNTSYWPLLWMLQMEDHPAGAALLHADFAKPADLADASAVFTVSDQPLYAPPWMLAPQPWRLERRGVLFVATPP